jgi:hypothetical protein
MQYKTAMISTPTSPSSNVPIYSELCEAGLSGSRRTIWKYNAWRHIAIEHITAGGKMPEILVNFLLKIYIFREEEQRLGIEEAATYAWQAENMIPHSDALANSVDNVGYERDKGGGASSASGAAADGEATGAPRTKQKRSETIKASQKRSKT